ncbi:MAG: hypothetical protein B7X11_00395, partial [Acidobacteria bacterium 37-65-4]
MQHQLLDRRVDPELIQRRVGELSLRRAVAGLFELVRTGAMNPLSALFVIALVILVTALVVFVERGQRKILVNYAKRQVGNK